MGRKLMCFFDGTSNRAVDPERVLRTNIAKLQEALRYGSGRSPQISFYLSGVGTRGDKLSMATGAGFDQIIMEAFINLAANYRTGDEIYLFGYSRGAAAARAPSELISSAGLLKSHSLASFPHLWEVFLDNDIGGHTKENIFEELQGKLVSPPPRVRFLGAFDTVAGTKWDFVKLFSKVRIKDPDVALCVDNAFQLLAIDDDRLPDFKPILWRSPRESQSLVQVWMPGVHGDVGGGSEGIFLGNVALLSMLNHLAETCPELKQNQAYLERLRGRVLAPPQHEITNDRSDFKMKLLGKGERVIGEFYDYEFIHPIFERQYGREFKVKGASRAYYPMNYTLSKLREMEVTEQVSDFWNTASLNSWFAK